MSTEYIQVVEEDGDDIVELPLEDDNTLSLATLQAQFPGVTGLKFRNEETNATRGLRLIDNSLQPPSDGWGSIIYYCVFPKENKRKRDDSADQLNASKRIELRKRCSDLIVIGLTYKTTDESLREYFEKFGELKMAQINKHKENGKSKGFGFIRYTYYDDQVKALSQKHLIDGRWCVVKYPRDESQQQSTRIFVGRCTEEITNADLKEYFSKFGDVVDVFIPKPFRSFAFITFADAEVAQSLCGEDHTIKDVSVYVSNAAPRSQDRRENNNNYGYGGTYSGRFDNRGGYMNNNMRGGGKVRPNVWENNMYNDRDMPNMNSLGMDSKEAIGHLLNNPSLVVAALSQMSGLFDQLKNKNYGNDQMNGNSNSRNYGNHFRR